MPERPPHRLPLRSGDRGPIKRLLAAAALGVLVLSGCSEASFQWRVVSIAGQRQCLPVASTLDAQQRGLQGVQRVVRPMVFAYSPPDTPSFWMDNTPSPLTGVWIGPRNRIVGYWHGQPQSQDLHPSPGPVSAVIEYRYGEAVPAAGAPFAIGPRCVTSDHRL